MASRGSDMSPSDSNQPGEAVTVQRLDHAVSIRLSESEKELISFLARQAGLSVGRYIVLACRSLGREQVKPLQELVQNLQSRARHDLQRVKRRRRNREACQRKALRPFKAPFLQRVHARSFERVVAYIAEKMHASEFSVARALSFFAEAVGDEVARGRVFRFPGFFILAAWRTERGVPEVVPRFQASPPLKLHVLFNCPLGQAKNSVLQAHRRRRRDRISLLPQAMEAFRVRVEAQDRSVLEGLEGWREFGP